MIVIVDYGMGNLGSILNMFKKIGIKAKISSDNDDIESAEKILLPGVGAFDSAMTKINQSGMLEVLNHKALNEKVPVLGICLGMQLLTKDSEEGQLPGLGWVPASTKRFVVPDGGNQKIPHMGWNLVKAGSNSNLTKSFDESYRFYFVHSYCVKCENSENSILTTNYCDSFDSGIQKDNIFGVQFHPEKSHTFGMQLLRNFSQL